ncbi:MAG: flagellar basal body P-ring protein FlgI [bacterium]|nr:flagellar basal body P-ring protein FlgI [bacterium]
MILGLLLVATVQMGLIPAAHAQGPAGARLGAPIRLKDIAVVQGATDNQIEGLGLVVGLKQSGDSVSTGFTERILRNLVVNSGVYLNQERIQVRNSAVVAVRATLPPFVKPGQKIDVTVASIGDAKSLADGVLIGAELRGPDGKVYATAEGALSTGGYGVEASGAQIRKNQTLVARIPNGGIVQREVPVTMLDTSGFLRLNLNQPDFVTASRVASSINQGGMGTAQAMDAGTIRIYVNSAMRDNLVDLIARLEQVPVQPDVVARVVVEERTGTVILGSQVRIAPVAVSQGGLIVRVDTKQTVSQPNPLSAGETTTTTETQISAEEEKAKAVVLESGTTLGQLVRALNALGTTPRELISILQAVKAAGALNAQLELI